MNNSGRRHPRPRGLGDIASGLVSDTPQHYYMTGIQPLDDLCLFVSNGELSIIAGSPSQGKTALAMQIAETIARNEGARVVFFSLEMGRAGLSMRMIAAQSGVDMNRLRRRARHPLTDREQEAVEAAASDLADLPLLVDERTAISGKQVYDSVAEWVQDEDVRPDVLMLDFVQLMQWEGDSPVVGLGNSIKALKAVARDFNLPFIVLSQVSRDLSKSRRRPTMADLRGSGELEQIADNILMFYYPNGPDDEREDIREAELCIVKQRQGPTGVANVQFNRTTTRFEVLE